MTIFSLRILSLLLIATASLGGYSSSARPREAHVSVALISSTDRPRPGQTFLVGFRLVPKAGWHTYWSNPGDSGLPTTVKWQASRNLQFGALLHPAPNILKVAGMTSFVHSGEHVLLARIRVNSSLTPTTSLPIKARLSWAICSQSLCVPQNAIFELNLVVGNGSPNAAAAMLEAAQRRIPPSLGVGRFDVQHDIVRLRLPTIAHIDSGRASFFPDENEILVASPVRVRVVKGKTEVLARRAGQAIPRRISGVLSDGQTAFRLVFLRAASR